MSEEKEIKECETDLETYKSKISQVNKATLTWDKELIFVGRTNRGYEVEYDAQQQWGCSPTETLLLSVAGCMGIFGFVIMMGAFVAPIVTGWIRDVTGSLAGGFYLAGALVLAGTLLLLVPRETVRRPKH